MIFSVILGEEMPLVLQFVLKLNVSLEYLILLNMFKYFTL